MTVHHRAVGAHSDQRIGVIRWISTPGSLLRHCKLAPVGGPARDNATLGHSIVNQLEHEVSRHVSPRARAVAIEVFHKTLPKVIGLTM